MTEETLKLVIDVGLACDLGLHESIVLTQLHKWVEQSPIEREGRKWVYKSLREMQLEAFPFWDHTTILRTINSLIKDGYVIGRIFGTKSVRATKWLTINYDKINLPDDKEV